MSDRLHLRRSDKKTSVRIMRGIGYHGIAYANAQTAGDAVIRQIKHNEEWNAQHGPGKVLFLDGEPVPEDQQLWTRHEIRHWRTENGTPGKSTHGRDIIA